MGILLLLQSSTYGNSKRHSNCRAYGNVSHGKTDRYAQGNSNSESNSKKVSFWISFLFHPQFPVPTLGLHP